MAKDSASADQADDQQDEVQITGYPGILATDDGRKADPRPVSERDFDTHIPPHVQQNYSGLVAEQYGGDWSALADQFDREEATAMTASRDVDARSHRVMAAWARKQAADGVEAATDFPGAGIASTTDGTTGQPVPDDSKPDEAANAPTGRRAPTKSTT